MDDPRMPWTLTPAGMVLVTLGAFLLAIVAASSMHDADEAHPVIGTIRVDESTAGSAAPATLLDSPSVAARRAEVPRAVVPMPGIVTECRRYAAGRAGQKPTAALQVSDERSKDTERYRRAYGSCMRSRGYTS